MITPTCPPPNSLPASTSLPIPSNVTYGLIHGQNPSDPAMTACCAPSALHLLAGCYEWCELPASYTNTSRALRTAAADFGSCLRSHGADVAVVGTNVSPAAGLRLSLRGVGLAALVAGCLLAY